MTEAQVAQQDAWIATRGGGQFRPFAAHPADIDIADIAHSLGNQCRFTGQCGTYYSVAQHAFECSMVGGPGATRDEALWLLLHDAAEAYLGDVASPMKRGLGWLMRTPEDSAAGLMFAGFGEVEATILRAVAARFALPWPMPAIVAEIDRRMLATERRDLFPPGLVWPKLDGVEPFGPRLTPVLPAFAQRMFLTRFAKLMA